MKTDFTAPSADNFSTNHLLQALVIGYVLLWAVLAIAPVDRGDWMLENMLAIVLVAALAATHRYFPLSNLSYILITAFLTLHAIGAHYTYAQVPIGFWLKDVLDLSRNHFDRLVHFAFGVLLVYPIWELLVRKASLRGFWSYYISVSATLALSGLFEIIEAWVAQIVNPGLGEAYLGTQGDTWDAQKDMTMALVGALLTMSMVLLIPRLFPQS
ncbi:MAG: DUF2238 domain-containing protein [Nitrospiraceae bacterium]